MSKSSAKESDLEKELAAACRGLVYISETDSTVEPFFVKKPQIPKGEEIIFDRFFERLTAKRDWHTVAESENAEGFAKLQSVLETELKDLHVYKIGKVQLEIVVVGRDKKGEFAGVRMKAVET